MDIDTYSLFDGVILEQNSFLFIGVEDARAEEPNSHGIIWKYKEGQWHSAEINETLVSCTLTDVDDYYFISIAETGKEFLIGDSGIEQNIIASGTHSPVSNGPLTNVNCIGGSEVFAVGTARQVYKKVGIRKWVRLDQTCKPEEPIDRARVAFLSVDGFSSEDVYAVGWDGQIWHFDGTVWGQIDSPTNLMLFSVYCCSNGDVYACGQHGTILKGQNSTWSTIEHDKTLESLRDIVEFDGKLFLCSNEVLYTLQNDELKIEDSSVQFRSYGKLKVKKNILLSIGLKNAAIFDGSTWNKLI